MATSKDQSNSAAKTAAKAAAKAEEPTYTKHAAALAADIRALVEGIREDLLAAATRARNWTAH